MFSCVSRKKTVAITSLYSGLRGEPRLLKENTENIKGQWVLQIR